MTAQILSFIDAQLEAQSRAKASTALDAVLPPTVLPTPYVSRPREHSAVDDVFQAINDGWYGIMAQVAAIIPYFVTIVTSEQSTGWDNPRRYQRPDEYEASNWNSLTDKGRSFVTALSVSGANVDITYDPTELAPFSFDVNKSELKSLAPFFKALGLTKVLDARGPQPQTVNMTLADYAKLSFDLTPRYDAENGGTPEPTVDPELEKLIADTGIAFIYTFQFIPHPSDDAGGDDFVGGDIHLLSTVTVPVDFFKWWNGSLSGTTPTATNTFPFTFAWKWVRMTCAAYSGYRAWPTSWATPQTMKARLDQFTQAVPAFQPRTGPTGWTVMPDGGLFKPQGLAGKPVKQRHGELLIEMENALDPLYLQQSILRKSGKTDENTMVQLSNITTAIADVQKKYSGRIMVVDWINDKVMRLTNEGNEEVSDLIGARALDPVTEFDYLNKSIVDRRLLGGVRDFVTRLLRFLNDAYDKDQRKSSGAKGIPEPGDLGRAMAYLNASNIKIEVKHLCGIDLDEVEDDEKDDGPKLAAYCRLVHDEAVRGWQLQPGGALAENNEATQTALVGWVAETISTLTPERYAEILSAQSAMQTRNKGKVDVNDLSVPNIQIRPGEFDSIMPHQQDTFSSLLNMPDVALIDVSAGGGKTIIFIIWILKQLEAGRIRRPMMITAGNLVPGFISEINSLANGKLNAVPLRMSTIREQIQRQNMTSVADLIGWIKGFPINTIFICAYTDFTSTQVLFDDWYVPAEYGTHAEPSYPFRQIMGACGFDFVGVDESQFIKNRNASRSLGVGYALCRAAVRAPGSGTMINNTVLDLHGQVGAAVHGGVFGPLDEFESRYALVKGNIEDPMKAQLLVADMRKHCLRVLKKKSDWAFLMPDLVPEFVFCEMTQFQTDYYNRLMTEALMEIRREMEKIKASNPDATQEELEARIQSMIDYRLQAVEQFLVGPDQNKDYTNPEGGETPAKADLISPEVIAADKVIDKHIAAGRKDKIIVFGYHKIASVHFMKHSRHRALCVQYTAGNLGAITRFKDPKGPFILVADENSMKQGHNLQIAGHIIRLQAVWAPGDYEQAISRMYRPDPRGVYNRQTVEHTWIIPLTKGGEATLAMAKSCRMISKAISNAQVNYAENSDWIAISDRFDDVPLLSMNMDLVFHFTREDAEPYLGAWGRLSSYENAQMKKVRTSVGSKLEKQHNVKLLNDAGGVIDIAQFIKYAMVPIKEAPELPGSKLVHTPWLSDAQPGDPHGLDLELVTTSTDNIATFREGQIVMTEFGPGQVQSIRANAAGAASSARVQTAVGSIGIPLAQIAVPAINAGDPADTAARQAKLKAMFNNLNTYALIPPGMQADPTMLTPGAGNGQGVTIQDPPSPTKPASPAQDEPVEQQEAQTLDLQAGLVNGMPMLFTRDPVEYMTDLHDGWGWVEPYIAVTFRTYKGAANFIDELNQQFWLSSVVQQRLALGLADFKRGASLRAEVLPNTTTIKDFFYETHHRLGAKDGYPNAKPYWMVTGHQPALVFNVAAHNPDALRWLTTKARSVQGVLAVHRYDGLWVNFFDTPKQAQQAAVGMIAKLKAMHVTVDIPNLNKTLKDASDMLATMRKNSTAQRGASTRQ